MKHSTRLGGAAALALALAAGTATSATATTEPVGTEPASTASGDTNELGASPEAAAAMDELYQAAIDNGETDIYIYGPLAVVLEDGWAAFSEAFPGITVHAESFSGPELETRLAGEFATGDHVADVLQNSDFVYLDLGYLAEYDPVGAEGFTIGQFPEEHMYSFIGEGFGIEYNTDLVESPEDVPASWLDLANPEFKGRIASGDLTTPGATINVLAKLWDAGIIDEAWLEELANNDISQRASLELAQQAVVRGEYDFGIAPPGAYAQEVIDSGAPVAFAFPLEGPNVLNTNFINAVEGSENPNAARLLVEYAYTPAFQEIAVEAGSLPLHPDVTFGDGLTIDDIEAVPQPLPREMRELYGTVGEITKEIFGSPQG